MKKRCLVIWLVPLCARSSSLFLEKAKKWDGTAKTEQTAKADGTVGSKSEAAWKSRVVNEWLLQHPRKSDEIIVANKRILCQTIIRKIQQPKAEMVKLIKAMQEAGFLLVVITVVLVMKLRPSSIKLYP